MHAIRPRFLWSAVLWSAAAIGSAAPAHAWAGVPLTDAYGGYAACSANYTAHSAFWCPEPEFFDGISTSYIQTIKIIQTGCGSGSCASQSPTTNTDLVYPTGRNGADGQGQCVLQWYTLGPCAC
jgi:hypothetical protein